jgi:hypothetical protein
MSTSIKLIPIIFAIYMVNACSEGNSDGNRDQTEGLCSGSVRCGMFYYFHFDQFFYDDQDVPVVGYRAFENNPDDITKFAKFNTDTYKWEASHVAKKVIAWQAYDVGKKVIAHEEITTAKGKTIVKNSDNAVVFEQSIPSISDIESQTDILLPNPQVYYEYFKSGKNYLWDRKTIIANVGINKEVTGNHYKFSKIHSFLFEYDEINNLWNIRHLRQLTPKSWVYYDSSDNSSNSPVSNISSIDRQKFFVNSNISLCQSWVGKDNFKNIYDDSIKCLVKYENGEVSLQKLYGEILPIEYSATIKKIYESKDFPRVYFDKNQNLYAFYSNADEAKGKYFYFEMYKPDQPTVAQHKQKIYWD